MGRHAEHLQIQALTAALPVCLNVVNVAGDCVHTVPFKHSVPTHATTTAANSDAPTVHLLHLPGHYVVLYQAKEAGKMEKVALLQEVPCTHSSHAINAYARAISTSVHSLRHMLRADTTLCLRLMMKIPKVPIVVAMLKLMHCKLDFAHPDCIADCSFQVVTVSCLCLCSAKLQTGLATSVPILSCCSASGMAVAMMHAPLYTNGQFMTLQCRRCMELVLSQGVLLVCNYQKTSMLWLKSLHLAQQACCHASGP